jgi:hypothetical protein
VGEVGLDGRPHAGARVVRHGREQQPVIVIDNFAPDPDRIVAHAAAQSWRPIGPVFPGVRVPTPPEFVAETRLALLPLIQKVFALDQPLNRIESYYSLITTPREQLTPIQRLPHIDGLGARRIAMVHHLSRAEQGGTAFYRHRSTGFETIDQARIGPYNLAVNRELARHGLPVADYVGGDTALYEQIGHHEARFNRLLIYRGDTIHGAHVPADVALTGDPRTGRFSINTFIWLDAS